MRSPDEFHDDVTEKIQALEQGDGVDSTPRLSFAIAEDTDTETIRDSLRDIAYDVMLEDGPVVELHFLKESTVTRYQQERNPFLKNVLTEGRSYA